MMFEEIINYLLKGDVSIQYQVYRDLLSIERQDLRDGIAKNGWGFQFLSKRFLDGHWGRGFYQPKWTSSHYTLLDLRNLCISPSNELINKSISKIISECKADDGGIFQNTRISDVCVNGMFLNYASYFKTDENDLKSVIDCVLREKMKDGGFNCRSNRSGANHSSLHTTLSVLEGFTEYSKNGYKYRLKDVVNSMKCSREFIMRHQLYISDRTGELINKDFLKLSYPRRWRYDVLSALDYFQYASVPWDNRLQPAINEILKKRNKKGTWNLQTKHQGQTHFEMEKAGKPSRWNTLRVLRVLKHFKIDYK